MIFGIPYSVICYIFTISLQFAGATILMTSFCGRTKSKVCQLYFPGSNIAKQDDEGNVVLKKEKIRDIVKNIYLNRIAFIFIALGALGSIYGENTGQNREKILLSVIVLSIILNVCGNLVATGLSKRVYYEDWKIPYSEVESKADAIATKKEIEDIFN